MKSFIRCILDWLRTALLIALVVAGIAGLWRLNFGIWRAAHPGAPTWSYFFSKH